MGNRGNWPLQTLQVELWTLLTTSKAGRAALCVSSDFIGFHSREMTVLPIEKKSME